MVNQCIGCKFLDPVALREGKPCCTWAFKPDVKAGVCFTRKQDPQGRKP